MSVEDQGTEIKGLGIARDKKQFGDLCGSRINGTSSREER